MNPDEQARRIRATRALTPPEPHEVALREAAAAASRAAGKKPKSPEPGITTAELAHRLEGERIGSTKVLGAVERGERTLSEGERREVARVCGIPPRWLLADDPFLGLRVEDRTAEMRQALVDLSPLLLAAAEQDAQDQLDQLRGGDSESPDAEDDDELPETGDQ